MKKVSVALLVVAIVMALPAEAKISADFSATLHKGPAPEVRNMGEPVVSITMFTTSYSYAPQVDNFYNGSIAVNDSYGTFISYGSVTPI